MKKRRNGLITVLILLALSSIAGPVLGALITFIIPVLAIVGIGFVISLVVGAVKGDGKNKGPAERSSGSSGRTIVNNNYTKSINSKSVNSKAKLDPEQLEKVNAAGGDIQKALYVLNTIKNPQVTEAARKALAKANWIVKTMKEQPEEIARSNQFFIYYIPTIKTILEKYRTIEQSGLNLDDNTKKVLEFFADTDKAFDSMYEGFFKDEKLDLEVEVEAMQMALKRDGLV